MKKNFFIQQWRISSLEEIDMKTLNKILTNKYLWWILLFLVLIALFIPALAIKFSWIDDGYDILISRQIVNSIRSLDFKGLRIVFFEGNGRLRIIYWFYQAFEYLLGGTNPLIHFAVHFSVIFATSIFIFEIVKSFTKSNLAGFFSGLLYLLSPINTENIYRLGPQEPILALFIVASLFYLIKRRFTLAILFLFLATLTKETGFVLWLPILLVYLLKRVFYKKRDIDFKKYCLCGIVFSLPVLATTLFRKSGYSQNYAFNIGDMAHSFSYYLDSVVKGFAPFFGIFVLVYLARLAWFFWKKRAEKEGLRFIEEGMFIAVFLVFLLIQLPWKFLLDRYLMPATVGLVIFLGIEFSEVSRLLTYNIKLKSLLGGIFLIYLTFMIGGDTLRIYLQGVRTAYSTEFVQKLFSDLAVSVPKGGTVLYNFRQEEQTQEPVIETGIHLGLFYNRPDITVSYLDLKHLPNSRFFIVGTSIIPEQYQRGLIEASIINYKSEENRVQENKFLVLTTPFNLVKQISKKLVQFVVYRKPVTSEGIYTYYISKDYWYKYDVKKQ